MQQLIYFFQKYKYFLFFLLLQAIALFLIINNNSFHKSKFISSANSIAGGLLEKTSQISDYFNLKAQNKELVLENEKLRNLLEKKRFTSDSTMSQTIVDTINFNQKYVYTFAKVIKNEYHKPNNYITVYKGVSDGIQKEMAVINSKGIIGITDAVTEKYARVQSILNSNSKINAKLKKNNHFGTLTWNGKAYNTVQLEDIPRQANVTVGDTIITGGRSSIFPEGILIGIVKSIDSQNNNSIHVELFNDMSAINSVYIVTNLDKKEIESLNNPANE